MDRASSESSDIRVLFETHFDDLWRFARRRVETNADADDVTAETFAVAWRRRHSLPLGEARLWLFGVARHVIDNHRRSSVRRARLHVRLVESRDEMTAPDHADDDSDERLGTILTALSESERELVIMRCWDGLAIGEIASLLGATPHAISGRLHRIRNRLAVSAGEGHNAGRPIRADAHERRERDDGHV
jgi:RNA polymerase sigma-70 factor (ECF subfamily)